MPKPASDGTKRPRGRPRKIMNAEEAGEPKPKRPRGRPRKVVAEGDASEPKGDASEPKIKRPRGRPRKHPLPEGGEPMPKRPRGRPPKVPRESGAASDAKDASPKRPRGRPPKHSVTPIESAAAASSEGGGDAEPQAPKLAFEPKLGPKPTIAKPPKEAGRRGRPPKDKSAASVILVSAPAADGTGAKPRGRPRKVVPGTLLPVDANEEVS